MMRLITPLFLVACAGGKSPEVGEVCAQFLSCMGSIGPAEEALYERSYGEESSCWSDAEHADACETACADSLIVADDSWPLVEECDLGNGYTAAEVFTFVGSYDVTVTVVDGDDPCDDIVGGSGSLDMEPQSGVAFILDGRVSFEGLYSQSIEGVDCELTWGGFTCEPFEGVLGENRIGGSFSPDLLTTTIWLDADASDQDPDTHDTVDCTYHMELLGTPG